jgi:hypothetical protein
MLSFPAMGIWTALAATLCLLVAAGSADAQRPRVRVSPHETEVYSVDGATITITYGRPSMKGRKIFGGLVPYNVVWMPGADEATVFQTSRPLQFDKIALPAGSYSLYTLPAASTWSLIINGMTGQFHTVYPAQRDLAKLPMAIERLASPVEQLTIAAVPRPGGGGAVQLEWELIRVSTPFAVLR